MSECVWELYEKPASSRLRHAHYACKRKTNHSRGEGEGKRIVTNMTQTAISFLIVTIVLTLPMNASGLTFNDAVQQALKNSATLQSAGIDVELARQDRRNQRLRMLPEVKVSSSATLAKEIRKPSFAEILHLGPENVAPEKDSSDTAQDTSSSERIQRAVNRALASDEWIHQRASRLDVGLSVEQPIVPTGGSIELYAKVSGQGQKTKYQEGNEIQKRLGIELSQDLAGFDRYRDGLKVRNRAVLRSRARELIAEYECGMRVFQAYFGMLKAAEEKEVAEAVLSRVQEARRIREERYAKGLIKYDDVNTLALLMMDLESAVQSARERIQIFAYDLSLLTGQSVTVDSLQESLKECAGTYEDSISGILQKMDSPEFVDRHPSCVISELELVDAENALRKEKQSRYPQASLSYSFDLLDPLSKTKRVFKISATQWRISLNVDHSILNWGAVKGEIREAMLKRDQARIMRRETSRDLRRMRMSALLDAKLAAIQWRSALASQESMETTYREHLARLQAGLLDGITFLLYLDRLRSVKLEVLNTGYRLVEAYLAARQSSAELAEK